MDELDVIFQRKNVYNRQSWYSESAPIFNNLEVLDEDRGYKKPMLDYDKFQKECYLNCDQLDIRYRDNFYCQFDFKKLLTTGSIDYAKKKFPLGNRKCCKKIAKDNDLAYLYCINAKDLYPLAPKSFHQNMILFTFMDYFFFIVFI